jgi:hypothetical protein
MNNDDGDVWRNSQQDFLMRYSAHGRRAHGEKMVICLKGINESSDFFLDGGSGGTDFSADDPTKKRRKRGKKEEIISPHFVVKNRNRDRKRSAD